MTVNKKEISIVWGDTSFTYDVGDASQTPDRTVKAEDLENGDSVAQVPLKIEKITDNNNNEVKDDGGNPQAINAGDYTIFVALEDPADSNRNENYVLSGGTSKDFKIAPLTIVVDGITAVTKEYDGTTDVTLDSSGEKFYKFTDTGKGDEITTVSKDDLDVASVTGVSASKDVGSRAVTIDTDNMLLAGNKAGNYTVHEFSEGNPTVTITQRPLYYSDFTITVGGVVYSSGNRETASDYAPAIANQIWTGSDIDAVIGLSDGVLATLDGPNLNDDYTITSSGTSDVGTATFTVTAVNSAENNFKGTLNWTFKIKGVVEFLSDSNGEVLNTRNYDNVAYSDIVEPTNPVRTGYDFKGWYLDGDDNKTPVTFTGNESDKITTSLTFIAIWQNQKRSVYFSSDGKTLASDGQSLSLKVEYEKSIKDNWTDADNEDVTGKITEVEEEEKTVDDPYSDSGRTYVFDGWYLGDERIGSSGEDAFQNYQVMRDVVLNARWKPKAYRAVLDFNSDGADGGKTYEIPTLENGEFDKPTDPAKAGSKFLYWLCNDEPYEWTKKDGKEIGVLSGGDLILKAAWDTDVYTVVFDYNSDGTLSSGQYQYGSVIGAVDDPARTGYTFDGWGLPSDGEQSVKTLTSTEAAALTVTRDMTLTAQWTRNEYTVKFQCHLVKV